MIASETKSVKTALYVVSEYGEFSSLIPLAKEVNSKLGLHPVFVFKHDYGALDSHTQQLDSLGISWVSSDNASLHNDFSSSSNVDDYLVNAPRVIPRPGAGLGTRLNAATALTWISNIVAVLVAPVFMLALMPLIIWRWARPHTMLRKMNSFFRLFPGLLRWRYSRLIREMRKIFALFNPAIVISGQDYPLSVTAIASFVAHEHGVATVIVPFSMTPTTKELAESFAGSKTNLLRGRFAKWLIMSRFTKWVNSYRGRLYTRLTFSEILAAEGLGLVPPLPWMPNSGRGVLLLPGQQSFDYCARSGIPTDQMRVTGAVWADQLWSNLSTRKERRAQLIRDIDSASLRPRSSFKNQKRHIVISVGQFVGETAHRKPMNIPSQDKKILLISWPPNQSPRAATGQQSYVHLCEELAKMLDSIKDEVSIAISLHPTLAGTDVQNLLEENDLFVLSAPLNEVIDCCDIFVATVSSTLLWSLQLGIPCINFDIYRYGYREFREAGMIEATSIYELRQSLLSIVQNPKVGEEIVEHMSLERSRWGLFDGHSVDRILDEISSLLPERFI